MVFCKSTLRLVLPGIMDGIYSEYFWLVHLSGLLILCDTFYDSQLKTALKSVIVWATKPTLENNKVAMNPKKPLASDWNKSNWLIPTSYSRHAFNCDHYCNGKLFVRTIKTVKRQLSCCEGLAQGLKNLVRTKFRFFLFLSACLFQA